MSGLKQQIEKSNAKAEKYLSQQKKKFGFKVTSNLGFWEGYLQHGKDVLEKLADYEKEEENIRGALAETITKLTAKIEYLEREIVNMREVKKQVVCIPKNKLEELREKYGNESHLNRTSAYKAISKLLEETK